MIERFTEDEILSENFTEKDQKLFDKLADFIVKRQMTALAILFLESSKPLSFVGSQFLITLGPIIKIFFDSNEYDRIAVLMEKRENIERLIQTIEKFSTKQ